MNAISVDFYAVIIPVASCVGLHATFHSYKSSQEGQSTLSPSHCPRSSHCHGWGTSLQHDSLGYLAQVLLLGKAKFLQGRKSGISISPPKNGKI